MMSAGQLSRQLSTLSVLESLEEGVQEMLPGGRSAGECSQEKGAQESAPGSQQAKTESPFRTGGGPRPLLGIISYF